MVYFNAFLGQDLSTWTNKDQEIANLLLALTIAGSNLPVTFVNNPFFKSYINHLNPQVDQSHCYSHIFIVICANVLGEGRKFVEDQRFNW